MYGVDYDDNDLAFHVALVQSFPSNWRFMGTNKLKLLERWWMGCVILYPFDLGFWYGQ